MLKKQKAFTLVELMVTVSILAIVMALAIPNFKTSMANNRSLGTGGDLVAALNLARTEAIRRGSPVTVCASNDGDSTTPTCLAAGNWARGWLVFADVSSNSTPTSATVLRYWKDLPVNIVVTAEEKPVPPATTGAAIDFIRFTGMGVLANAKDLDLKVSMAACKGEQKSQVTVGIAGLITSKKVSCP